MPERRIALVTGANKGIGLEAARQLGGHDFTILLAARNASSGVAAAEQLRGAGIDAHAITLDVTDQASVERAAKQVADTWGRVDVLVNNAGVAPEFASGTPPSKLSLETLRETYETNVFGVVAVTNQFLPLLRKAAPSRIINVSSALGSLGAWSGGSNILAYNSSKTALNGVTLAYARELGPEGIAVVAISPGWVRTDMGSQAAPRSVEEGAKIITKVSTMATPPNGKFINDEGEIPW
jgi:NAD(P)-dependent dehydrogenase (short-subunit alcohol dehydrogenase family)